MLIWLRLVVLIALLPSTMPMPHAKASIVDRSPRASLRAVVAAVSDGDTIRVRQGQRQITVRLACIDAPEKRQAPHGTQSRARLSTLAPVGSSVTLLPQAIDRYGRTVAEVVTTRGENVNQAMVEQGQAFVFRRYLAGGCDVDRYLLLERRAEAARIGVWVQRGGGTRPWGFRAARRNR